MFSSTHKLCPHSSTHHRQDTDVDGHGSHVTGIIGASDNSQGMVGVAPASNLYMVRVFDSNGIYASDLVAAMDECVQNGAKVISMSLGGPGRSNSEESFFQSLFDSGIVLVAASGNSGDGQNPVEYPAGYDSVISVRATDEDRNIASFSSFNEHVSLVAPGVNIRSLGIRNDNDYQSLSGK
jgi:serine protease